MALARAVHVCQHAMKYLNQPSATIALPNFVRITCSTKKPLFFPYSFSRVSLCCQLFRYSEKHLSCLPVFWLALHGEDYHTHQDLRTHYSAFQAVWPCGTKLPFKRWRGWEKLKIPCWKTTLPRGRRQRDAWLLPSQQVQRSDKLNADCLVGFWNKGCKYME